MKPIIKNIFFMTMLFITFITHTASTDTQGMLRPLIPPHTSLACGINNSGQGIYTLHDRSDANILVVIDTNFADGTREDDIAFILPDYGVAGPIEYLNCTINDSNYRIVSFHSTTDNTVRTLRYVPGTGWDNSIPVLYTSTEFISNNYIKLASNGVGLIVFQEATSTTTTGDIITFATNDFGATWTQVTFSDTAARLRDPGSHLRFSSGNTQVSSFAMDESTGQAVLLYGTGVENLERNPNVRAAFFDPTTQTWSTPTTLSDGSRLDNTSFHRVAAINKNGHATAGWISISNSFPYTSTGHVTYYDGTSWKAATNVTDIITAPSTTNIDSISVALNNNNHAVAVWAGTQFNSKQERGYGIGSLQQTGGAAWTAVSNVNGILPQTVSLEETSQISKLTLHLNDKEQGYAIFVNQDSIVGTARSFSIAYFNGSTNTWGTPYDVNTIRNILLTDISTYSSFAYNPDAAHLYGLSIIYTGSPYGTKDFKTNVFGSSSFGSGRPFMDASVTLLEDITLTSSCYTKPLPYDDTYILNPAWVPPYRKSISWTAPSDTSRYGSISIIRTTNNPDQDQYNPHSLDLIATKLPVTTTSYKDENQPPTAQYYKVYYVEKDNPEKATGTQSIAINCTSD